MTSEELINTFGNNVVERAMRNLGATRTVNGKVRRAVTGGSKKGAHLINSLSFTSSTSKGILSFKFGVDNSDVAKYANVVEYGRGPNKKQPPVDAILEWMKVKPIRVRDPKTNAFKKATEAEKRGIAFVIARAIGKRGIPGLSYFRDALRDELNDGGKELIDAIGVELLKEITILDQSTITVK